MYNQLLFHNTDTRSPKIPHFVRKRALDLVKIVNFENKKLCTGKSIKASNKLSPPLNVEWYAL